jgi:hypothetical protein
MRRQHSAVGILSRSFSQKTWPGRNDYGILQLRLTYNFAPHPPMNILAWVEVIFEIVINSFGIKKNGPIKVPVSLLARQRPALMYRKATISSL